MACLSEYVLIMCHICRRICLYLFVLFLCSYIYIVVVGCEFGYNAYHWCYTFLTFVQTPLNKLINLIRQWRVKNPFRKYICALLKRRIDVSISIEWTLPYITYICMCNDTKSIKFKVKIKSRYKQNSELMNDDKERPGRPKKKEN